MDLSYLSQNAYDSYIYLIKLISYDLSPGYLSHRSRTTLILLDNLFKS